MNTTDWAEKSLEEVVSDVAAWWHARNPWVSAQDFTQAAWLEVLENGGDRDKAYWNAKRGCAKLLSELKAPVSLPYQYMYGKTETAQKARGAYRSISLSVAVFDDGEETLQDRLEADGESLDALVETKREVETAQSLCCGKQRIALDGLLAGMNTVEIAQERGVSRQKISSELTKLGRRMRELRSPKKVRIKRKRRMELTRGLLMRAFAGYSSMNANQIVLAIRKLGFRIRDVDAHVRLMETGLVTWTEGDPEKRIKGVYRLVTPNSIRAKKVVKVYDVPCKRCGVVVQRKHARKEALCADCEKAWKREWYLKQKEGK